MQSGEDLNQDFRPETEAGGLTIRLDVFQGPLDLLLHLIKREEVDIWNIPIARITEQYLEYLEIMKELNINVAAEWLVMASTLIFIKSRMLLPREPAPENAEETEDDPRTELVYQLLEHQKFKNAAEMLFTREEVENAVWNRPPDEVLEDGGDVIAVTLFDLLRAFQEVVRRFESQRVMEVAQEEVTIEQKIEDIRKCFLVHDQLQFSSFFTAASSKRYIIVTFLALLELVRLREIWLFQQQVFEEIQVSRIKESA
ncbi:MAG: segregation/condensation protein A [Acidobacteriota bacterium]|jgi:segregation and condensation protein A|nr:segregation/condensation protein A [Acidobacteriota bacterium]NLT32025.1 segregation/condensation protein A [Acidobacteriota bacterium]